MMDAVKQLGEHYPQSPWRLKALIAAGNRYLLTNDREKYIPLFKAAAETFPTDSTTAYGHWKVAWDAYLTGKPGPRHAAAGTGGAVSGRLARRNGPLFPRPHRRIGRQVRRSQGLLRPAQRAVPALLLRRAGASSRCATSVVAAAAPDDDAVMWLADVDWPAHRDLSATEPNAATEQRIERARLLTGAGLPDVAEAELRFGARHG